MITNVSLATVWVTDQDEAKAFYRRLPPHAGQGLPRRRGPGDRRRRKTYEELSAKGVTFLQEPADRSYGVEAVLRDNSGNWLVLVEQKPFTGEAFGPGT